MYLYTENIVKHVNIFHWKNKFYHYNNEITKKRIKMNIFEKLDVFCYAHPNVVLLMSLATIAICFAFIIMLRIEKFENSKWISFGVFLLQINSKRIY